MDDSKTQSSVVDSDGRMKVLREKYEADPRYCKHCGTAIPFEKRRNTFCGHSCRASFHNRGTARNQKNSRVCQCGNPKKLQNKYCQECSDKRVYQRPKSLEDVRDVVAIKRFLIEQRGHRCQDCGLTEWKEKPIPLELHHVNGDTDENTEENLQLLCPNCHAFTDHYKGANKGKDGERQRARRKRYSEGRAW